MGKEKLTADEERAIARRDAQASALHADGKLTEAIDLYWENWELISERFGIDSPRAIEAYEKHAEPWLDRDETPEGVVHWEKVAAEVEAEYGADHLETLIARAEIPWFHAEREDFGQAAAAYERLLTDNTRVLGIDHHQTLATVNNLAGAYESLGELPRALAMYEENLARSERALGRDHPLTMTCRNNLAYIYDAVGDLARALPLYEQTLEDRTRVLGADDSDTVHSREVLARAMRDQIETAAPHAP